MCAMCEMYCAFISPVILRRYIQYNHTYKQTNEGLLTRLVTTCILTAFWNTLLEKKNVEGMERREIRRKRLLDNFKEKRRYWKLKEESLDRTLWRTRCGRVWTCRKTDVTWWCITLCDIIAPKGSTLMVNKQDYALVGGDMCTNIEEDTAAPTITV